MDREDPDRWYVSTASGPRPAHGGERAHGRLYRWEGAWRALVVPGQPMPYALGVAGGDLIAGMADGRVLGSGDRGETWDDL